MNFPKVFITFRSSDLFMMSGRLIELNASPWLWIETTWVIIFSALAPALRIIVRSHEYGFEDTLLVLAFVSRGSTSERTLPDL